MILKTRLQIISRNGKLYLRMILNSKMAEYSFESLRKQLYATEPTLFKDILKFITKSLCMSKK